MMGNELTDSNDKKWKLSQKISLFLVLLFIVALVFSPLSLGHDLRMVGARGHIYRIALFGLSSSTIYGVGFEPKSVFFRIIFNHYLGWILMVGGMAYLILTNYLA